MAGDILLDTIKPVATGKACGNLLFAIFLGGGIEVSIFGGSFGASFLYQSLVGVLELDWRIDRVATCRKTGVHVGTDVCPKVLQGGFDITVVLVGYVDFVAECGHVQVV